MQERNPSVDPNVKDSGVNAGLNPHDQRIVDYAMHAATAATRVATEEVVSRTRIVVSSEIQLAFREYTKITTTRKVAMIAGGLAAFGLGWIVKGLVGPSEEETDTNGVSHPS